MPRPDVPVPRPSRPDVEVQERFRRQTAGQEGVPVFVIACGGYTEAVYFEDLIGERDDIVLVTLPPLTRVQSSEEHDRSSPLQTVERALERVGATKQDQVWIVLDVDHHFDESHLSGTQEALEIAKAKGYNVVFSNPCFEVWILMHTEEVLASWPQCKDVVTHIRLKWKGTPLRGYGKKTFKTELLFPHIRNAIERGKRSPNVAQTPPRNPGTQVHLLLEALDLACGETKLF